MLGKLRYTFAGRSHDWPLFNKIRKLEDPVENPVTVRLVGVV